MRHVTSISPPFSADCAYFPSPRGCIVIPSTFRASLSPLCLRVSACPDRAGLANPMFSVVCRLFVALCALFRTPSLCFQQLAASFCKMPGVGGIPIRSLDSRRESTKTSRCRRRSYGTPGVGYQLREGALKLSTYNCQPSASLRQPGGPVRGAGRRRSAGRRFGQARRCLPSPAVDALRPRTPSHPQGFWLASR